MNTLIIEYSLDQVAMVAKQCAYFMQDISVVTLTGSLGAGKTSLVSAILKNWGVQGPVISPTFTYVNSYRLPEDGRQVYHFDLYRLETQSAFEQAGFNEYIYADKTICLVEWPEIIMPLLTHGVCHISIEFLGLEKRRLTCSLKK